jgi:NADH dehydrogenase
MLLVVGSTGMVGSEICRRLVGDGQRVRALVRGTSDPGRVEALRAAGAEPFVGDLRMPETLEAACRGVDTVISTVSAMPHSYVPGINDLRTTDLLGMLELIAAAGRTGVHRFVYTSFSGSLDTPCPLESAKRTIEARLRGGMLEYTILRPTCFMETWLGPAVGFDPIDATATIFGPGTRPISWISATDVAAFAVYAALSATARNSVLELGGPEAISPLEAVAIFERVGGRPFTVQHVPLEVLETQRREATDPMAESFAALMCSYARGDEVPMEAVLAGFPLPMTSVESYAAKVYGRVPAHAA